MFLGLGFWSLGMTLYGVATLLSSTTTTEMAWSVVWILGGVVTWRVLRRSNAWWI